MAESLVLDDGRSLEIAVSGPDGGQVCLFHHGTPGSVMQVAEMADAVHRRGLRLVTYSRAGYGASSRRPGRTVADVAGDMRQVLDHVGAESCVVLGWSGGGPHALATAALLPDRVRAVSSLAGVKPFTTLDDFVAGMGDDNVEEFSLAVQGEEALRPFMAAAVTELTSNDMAAVLDSMASILPPVDREAIGTSAGAALMTMAFGSLGAGDGWLDDDLVFSQPWGFELADVRVPTYVWQGSEDLMVPVEHGRILAREISGAVHHEVDGAGHLSLITDHLDEILDEVAAHL